MIPLIPYQRWTIYTSLTLDQAMTRLSGRVYQQQPVPRTWFVGDFEGQLSENSFRLRRVLSHRNQFLPMINDYFYPEQDRLKIELRATTHPYISIFGIVWFAGVILKGVSVGASVLGIFSFLAFGYVLVQWPFINELRKTNEFFDEIFPLIVLPA